MKMTITVLLASILGFSAEPPVLTRSVRAEIDAKADSAPWAPLKHQRFDVAGDVVGWAASRLPLDENEEAQHAAEALKQAKDTLSPAATTK